MRRCTVTLVLLLFTTATTATEPLPDPRRVFDWTVGSWEGTRTDGTDGDSAPMTMRVEAVLAGAGQARQLEVETGSGTYRGYAVQLYDPDLGRWVRQYANDVRRRFMRLECVEVGLWRSVWSPPPEEGRRPSRLVSERLADGRWRRTMQVSDDGGESWRVLWRDDLRRVAAGVQQE